MSYPRHMNQYQKTAVVGASPLQLVIMLYDGAIRFMNTGKVAMVEKRTFEQNEALQKAQKIVVELLSCLDMNKGGDVAKNLFALYTFAYNELIAANLEDQPAKIDTAIRVLTELRESWVQLDANTRSQSTEARLDISSAA